MKLLTGLFILFIHSSVLADTTTLSVLKDKIEALCPDAEIIETEHRDGFTEVEFLCNGHQHEAGFDLNSRLMYLQSEASPDEEVRAAILKKLDKSHPDWIMDDFHLMETSDTAFFVVEMEKNGIESNVYFTLDGKYYRPTKVSAGENLTSIDFKALYESRQARYNFMQPSHIYDLPELLREVSGIVMASENSLYLVQDELGAVFEYDLKNEEVIRMTRFTDEGDFEDVSTDGTFIYVLRSDGTLFKFQDSMPESAPEIVRVPVQVTDVEGLFYAAAEDRFLLVGKNEPVNGENDVRLVYSIKKNALTKPEIMLEINIPEINNMLKLHYPSLKNQTHSFAFNPSAIAIHPFSGELFILSASDRLLAVYEGSTLKEVYPLPAELYYKPEGLAFSGNGNLYLSSEGIKNGWLSGRVFLINQEK